MMERKITVKDDFKTMERIVYKDGKKIISITSCTLKKIPPDYWPNEWRNFWNAEFGLYRGKDND